MSKQRSDHILDFRISVHNCSHTAAASATVSLCSTTMHAQLTQQQQQLVVVVATAVVVLLLCVGEAVGSGS
jgi:hypothetical protein